MSVASPLRELIRLLDELQNDQQQFHDQALNIWRESLATIDKTLLREIDRCSFVVDGNDRYRSAHDIAILRGRFRQACLNATGRQVHAIYEANARRYLARLREIERLRPIAERTAQETRLIAPPERVHNALTLFDHAVDALNNWHPAYSTDELFDQRLGNDPNSDGTAGFRSLMSESAENLWARAIEQYGLARSEIMRIANVCEPLSDGKPFNPFHDLIDFANRVIQQETNRLSSMRKRRDSAMDIADRTRQTEVALHGLIDAAFAAGRQTGFPMEIVEKRIRTLEQICRDVISWQQHTPKPGPNPTHPDDPDPASGYLIPIYDRFVKCASDVRALATAYQPTSANVVGTPTSTQTPLALNGLMSSMVKDRNENASLGLGGQSYQTDPSGGDAGQNATIEVNKAGSACIVSHGNRLYSVGKFEPITLTLREDTVLQTFCKFPCLDHPTLVSKSGYEDAPRVLSQLCRKYDRRFEPAIQRPGKKSQGGYRVTIRVKVSGMKASE